MSLRFGLFLFAMMQITSSVCASNSIRISRDSGWRVDLVSALMVVDVVGADLDSSAAWSAVEEGRLRPLGNAQASLGFLPGVRWFHVRVVNVDQSARRWLLTVEQPRLDDILIEGRYRDGERFRHVLGDHQPFAERSVRHRFPNIELRIAPGDDVQLLIGVRSTSSIQLPLRLYTPTELLAETHNEQAGLGMYYGILLALFLYNLAVLVSIRDASYAYYLSYLAAFGLLMLSFNGFGYQYLWPRAIIWQSAALPIAIGAVLCSSTLFASSFLGLRQRMPRVDRVIRWSIPFIALMMLGAFTAWQRQVTELLNLGLVGFSLIVTAAAVVSAWRGYRPAWYFLLAWGSLIAGGVALPLSSFGLLPRSTITEYGLQFGSALEMLLLSFSLAYRIHLLRIEKLEVERVARETLEQRVEERTRALAQSAAELADANARLEDSSRRDGLTGVYNRRHLEETLRLQWQRAAEHADSLAVLMIDIDHFKKVNDSHGHGAGDDCLRQVATLLQQQCEPSAVVARYGGEEFMVVLPGRDGKWATSIAETLRNAIATALIDTEAGPIHVTVSIGVAATQPPANIAAAELRRAADGALYAAKRGGRNRVETAAL